MRRMLSTIVAFVSFTIITGCDTRKEEVATYNGDVTSSKAVVVANDSIQEDIYTCISNIEVELIPEDVEGLDGIWVYINTTDKSINEALDYGNSVSLTVWKDTSTVIEDSAVYSSRNAKLRKVNDNRFAISSASYFRDYITKEMLDNYNEELRENPQIRFKMIEGEGKEWIVRSCQ